MESLQAAAVVEEWSVDPGVSRVLDLLRSYSGLPLVVRSALARAAENRKKGQLGTPHSCGDTNAGWEGGALTPDGLQRDEFRRRALARSAMIASDA
jgi:hypothetical protein